MSDQTPSEARPKLYIATPAHDHRFDAGYVFSLLRLINSRAYPLKPSKVGGAGVARARNNQAAEFLASDCRYFFCIDSDITFAPEHVAALVERDLPIVCGLYSLKQHELAWCVNALPGETADPSTGLQKVRCAGTGFMCIRRDVFERMIAAHPEIAYAEDIPGHQGEPRWDFFSMGVVAGRYLTEDWYFCHRARQLGIDILVDTRFHVKHTGIIDYPLQDVFASEELSAPAPLWPADVLAAGIALDHCADVLAGSYDVPFAPSTPPVILDIGANIGAFARWAVQRWPGCEIRCYEPDPANVELLSRTVKALPEARVTIFPFAVLDREARLPLRRGAHNCGEHSLFDVGEQTAETVEVPVVSAATLPPADILKLDTEGSELPILQVLDRSERLPQFAVIVLEYHSEADRASITDLLLRRGFTLHAARSRCPDRGELKFLRTP